MRLKIYLIIYIVTSIIVPVKGETKSPDISHVLINLYDRILFTNIDSERERLNDSIKLIIGSYVNSDSIFEHRFSEVRYLGQIISPDARLKIVTWNLVLREGSNKYFCYLIRKGEKGEKNLVYELSGENREEKIRTDITYSDKTWYGALYYNILPFKRDNKIYYILLGIDFGNMLLTRKIIDILSFPEEGGILLGNDCFLKGELKKFREVLEYSSEGVVTLRIHTPKMIVFDRLAVYSDDSENSGQQYGAEFRYDAYVLKKGTWLFTENVDVKNKK